MWGILNSNLLKMCDNFKHDAFLSQMTAFYSRKNNSYLVAKIFRANCATIGTNATYEGEL